MTNEVAVFLRNKKRDLGVRTNQELAEVIGVESRTIARWKKKGHIPPKQREKVERLKPFWLAEGGREKTTFTDWSEDTMSGTMRCFMQLHAVVIEIGNELLTKKTEELGFYLLLVCGTVFEKRSETRS